MSYSLFYGQSVHPYKIDLIGMLGLFYQFQTQSWIFKSMSAATATINAGSVEAARRLPIPCVVSKLHKISHR